MTTNIVRQILSNKLKEQGVVDIVCDYLEWDLDISDMGKVYVYKYGKLNLDTNINGMYLEYDKGTDRAMVYEDDTAYLQYCDFNMGVRGINYLPISNIRRYVEGLRVGANYTILNSVFDTHDTKCLPIQMASKKKININSIQDYIVSVTMLEKLMPSCYKSDIAHLVHYYMSQYEGVDFTFLILLHIYQNPKKYILNKRQYVNLSIYLLRFCFDLEGIILCRDNTNTKNITAIFRELLTTSDPDKRKVWLKLMRYNKFSFSIIQSHLKYSGGKYKKDLECYVMV
jgi:hypothetical protein